MTIQTGSYVLIKTTSLSKHAGKVGKCHDWCWQSGRRAYKIYLSGGGKAVIAESSLRVIPKAQYDNIMAALSPAEESKSEMFYVIWPLNTCGPMPLTEAKKLAQEVKTNNESAQVIIARGILEVGAPKTVVEFTQIK